MVAFLKALADSQGVVDTRLDTGGPDALLFAEAQLVLRVPPNCPDGEVLNRWSLHLLFRGLVRLVDPRYPVLYVPFMVRRVAAFNIGLSTGFLKEFGREFTGKGAAFKDVLYSRGLSDRVGSIVGSRQPLSPQNASLAVFFAEFNRLNTFGLAPRSITSKELRPTMLTQPQLLQKDGELWNVFIQQYPHSPIPKLFFVLVKKLHPPNKWSSSFAGRLMMRSLTAARQQIACVGSWAPKTVLAKIPPQSCTSVLNALSATMGTILRMSKQVQWLPALQSMPETYGALVDVVRRLHVHRSPQMQVLGCSLLLSAFNVLSRLPVALDVLQAVTAEASKSISGLLGTMSMTWEEESSTMGSVGAYQSFLQCVAAKLRTAPDGEVSFSPRTTNILRAMESFSVGGYPAGLRPGMVRALLIDELKLSYAGLASWTALMTCFEVRLTRDSTKTLALKCSFPLVDLQAARINEIRGALDCDPVNATFVTDSRLAFFEPTDRLAELLCEMRQDIARAWSAVNAYMETTCPQQVALPAACETSSESLSNESKSLHRPGIPFCQSKSLQSLPSSPADRVDCLSLPSRPSSTWSLSLFSTTPTTARPADPSSTYSLWMVPLLVAALENLNPSSAWTPASRLALGGVPFQPIDAEVLLKRVRLPCLLSSVISARVSSVMARVQFLLGRISTERELSALGLTDPFRPEMLYLAVTVYFPKKKPKALAISRKMGCLQRSELWPSIRSLFTCKWTPGPQIVQHLQLGLCKAHHRPPCTSGQALYGIYHQLLSFERATVVVWPLQTLLKKSEYYEKCKLGLQLALCSLSRRGRRLLVKFRDPTKSASPNELQRVFTRFTALLGRMFMRVLSTDVFDDETSNTSSKDALGRELCIQPYEDSYETFSIFLPRDPHTPTVEARLLKLPQKFQSLGNWRVLEAFRLPEVVFGIIRGVLRVRSAFSCSMRKLRDADALALFLVCLYRSQSLQQWDFACPYASTASLALDFFEFWSSIKQGTMAVPTGHIRLSYKEKADVLSIQVTGCRPEMFHDSNLEAASAFCRECRQILGELRKNAASGALQQEFGRVLLDGDVLQLLESN